LVGLDFVGDEIQHPVCPFVHDIFINFAKERIKDQPHFGFRIHCGENLPIDTHVRTEVEGFYQMAVSSAVLIKMIE